MWRTLEQIAERLRPNLQEPAEADPGEPEDAEFTDTTDPSGADIWFSTAETLEEAFAQLDPGECTFAHLGDDVSLPRQCKAPDGSMVPPPAGRLFYPAGVAADGTSIFVVDRSNHRITTMRYDGTAFDIAHPIGNGAPGDGTYGLPGDEFVYTSGVNGSQLNTPNAVAVDAAHHVLVADGGNGRVAIFNPDGTQAFAPVPVPPGIDGSDEVIPTAIAISPGAVVLPPGSTPTGDAANHRIVVADRFTCAVQIFDTSFRHLHTLPAEMPAAPDEGACTRSDEYSGLLSAFSLIGGVAVDRQGNIFVADPWNNRIVVFNRDGGLIGQFGDPGPIVPGVEPPVDTLRTPSAIIVDSRDRIVVADTDKVRLAVFTVDVTDDGVTAAFQFEVPTSGDDVEGVPTGIAEQRGPAPDLDPAGRYLRVDTANHQVQRYELADLAIVRQAVSYTTDTTGSGVFAVAVPVEKAGAVLDVVAEVQPPPDVTISNFRVLPPFDPNPLVGIDIPRGTWVEYAFDFEVEVARMAAEFTITAAGNQESGQATEADPVTLLVRGACDDCDIAAAVYNEASGGGSPVPATPFDLASGRWFNQRVFVRLEPTDSDPPVQFVEWFVRGTELPIYGHKVKVSEITEDAPYLDVPFGTPESTITYRAVTSDNTVGPERTLALKIDVDGPVIGFNFFVGTGPDFLTPPSGFNAGEGPDGTLWWNTDVSATYTVVDDHSGTAATGGTMVVSGEGRNLSRLVSAVDLVGHSSTAPSNEISLGGEIVNIDRTGPVVTAPANLVLMATGPVSVPESFSGGATAVDHISGLRGGVTASGPATVQLNETVEWTFSATDWAGNTTSEKRTVTAAASWLAYTGAPQAGYGGNLSVSATLEPASATGQLKFTLIDPLRGNREVTGVLSGGAASGVIDGLVSNVGTYQLLIEYIGTDVPPTSLTVPIAVVPRLITARANDTFKLIGTDDPPFTASVVEGSLIAGDQFSGALTRAPGELLGDYSIHNAPPRGTLTLGPNYALTVQPGTLSILAILPGNEPPEADAAEASGAGAAPLDIPVLANDSDPNGDALRITTVTQPAGGASVGTVTISGSMVKFTPAPGFAGAATFTYTVTDNKGGFATASVTVTITAAACTPGTIHLNANGGQTSGTAGNIRKFIGAGVKVNASAWGRTRSTHGSWAKAYLGAFGSAGLGVTDGSEGSGSNDRHKVDNSGDRLNFVLFEFSTPVTVSRAFLSYVGDDSDITVWIATRPDPFTNRLTLSDEMVASFGTPIASSSSSSSDRWAAFNAGNVTGNVLLIAADVTDMTPEDAFKIAKLEVTCPSPNVPPTVTAAPQRHDEGASISVRISGADADGDDLTYAAAGLPPGLSINRTSGLISGTLSYSSAGAYQVKVTVTDERGAAATAPFVWTVVNKNRPPAAGDDAFKTAKNTPKTMAVLANDTDPDGDAITLVSVAAPPGFKGTVVKNANGTIKYTPPKNFTGTTSFTYTVKDAAGVTDSATVSVKVDSHRDDDDCDRDHDHDGDRDRDDDRERDCDRDHRHDRECDRDRRYR